MCVCMCVGADVYTDASLSAHEQYVVLARAQYAACAPVLADIATREKYRVAIQDHRFNQANPEVNAMKYTGRYAHKALNQLVEITNIIDKRAPKLDVKIIAALKVRTTHARTHARMPARPLVGSLVGPPPAIRLTD